MVSDDKTTVHWYGDNDDDYDDDDGGGDTEWRVAELKWECFLNSKQIPGFE